MFVAVLGGCVTYQSIAANNNQTQLSVQQPSSDLYQTNTVNREELQKSFLAKTLDSKLFNYLNDINPFDNTKTNDKKQDNQNTGNNNTVTQKTTTNIPVQDKPSLYQLLTAEFLYNGGNTEAALQIYKEQSFKKDATTVFERALTLSLEHEEVTESLEFAHAWHVKNPEHTPAWFFVAHLSLKAHNYKLAGETLEHILEYDPQADLTEILMGIYPENEEEQRQLLLILQQLNIEQNAYLSVLEAGLLLKFDNPKAALGHINRAVKLNPDSIAYITLKADILKRLERYDELSYFLEKSIKRLPEQKSLYLYKIVYLLDRGLNNDTQLDYNAILNAGFDDTLNKGTNLSFSKDFDIKRVTKAWNLLIIAHKKFPDDPDLTLLTALVSLDLEKYQVGDQLLSSLLERPAFTEQAQHYLTISAERQKSN